MRRFPPSAAVALFLLFVAASAMAQSNLSNLWPVDLGRQWEFDVRVEGPFGQIEIGTLTQSVVSERSLPSGVVASCFSVQSTGLGGSPRGPLPSLLLAVPDCEFDVGVLADDPVALGVWSDAQSDWSWWWIPTNPAPGASFRLPIRTGISNDAFVNGVVRSTAAAVTTPAGSFTNALIVDYVVELGQSEIVDATLGVIGTARFETVGWIAFVPDVGPVASEESYGPATIDCPGCPPEIFESITTTMSLRASTPVSTEQVTFGSIKAQF